VLLLSRLKASLYESKPTGMIVHNIGLAELLHSDGIGLLKWESINHNDRASMMPCFKPAWKDRYS